MRRLSQREPRVERRRVRSIGEGARLGGPGIGVLALAVALASTPAHASGWASALDLEPAAAVDFGVDAPSGPAPSTEEEAAEARAAFTAGSREYSLGNYETAVSHFERSFELSQRPELLFNIAQSYARWYEISDDIEHLRKSERLYKNYVAYLDSDSDPDPAAKADAEQAMAEVEHLIAAHKAREGGDSRRRGSDDDRPVHKKGWFWVAVIGGAALIAGGVAAGVVLSRPQERKPELGTIGMGPGGLGVRF